MDKIFINSNLQRNYQSQNFPPREELEKFLKFDNSACFSLGTWDIHRFSGIYSFSEFSPVFLQKREKRGKKDCQEPRMFCTINSSRYFKD